jgi:prephenate dehydrogenase
VSEPPFRRVAIYGLGLIGGSIALAVKRRWPDAAVVAIDRPHVVEAAVRMRIADSGGHDPRAADGADLVMLAAPVLQNVAALRELPGRVAHPAVVTDAGSTKRSIMAAAERLPGHLQFVGGHPLAGAATSGLEAARPDLFDDRPWILTAREGTPDDALWRLTEFVRGLRAIPHRMEAAEHDRLLAYISHLPQLAVSAMMHVVGNHAGEEGLALAGRGLRDTTRLASSPAATWADIVATNGDNITSALDDLIAALQQLRSASADDALERMFTSAARWKGVLEHG